MAWKKVLVMEERSSFVLLAERSQQSFSSLCAEYGISRSMYHVLKNYMEAALRTAYEIVTGRDVPFENLNIEPVRGMEGVKAAAIRLEGWQFLEGVEVKVAIAHGLVNARKVCATVVEGGRHGTLSR